MITKIAYTLKRTLMLYSQVLSFVWAFEKVCIVNQEFDNKVAFSIQKIFYQPLNFSDAVVIDNIINFFPQTLCKNIPAPAK